MSSIPSPSPQTTAGAPPQRHRRGAILLTSAGGGSTGQIDHHKSCALVQTKLKFGDVTNKL